MPTPALIATQLTDHSARPKTLTVGGLDVLGLSGTAYSVPIESVTVDEQGPGGVSSMSFDIWDRLAEVTIEDGDEVEFWDVTRGWPNFGGYVSSWSQSPAFGGSGRIIKMSCAGYEVLLDWAALVTNLTIPVTDIQAAFQMCVANTEGTGPIRAFGGISSSPTQALPTAFLSGVSLLYAITITAGTSLREALRQIVAACGTGQSGRYFKSTSDPQFTLDFWRGLRLAAGNAASGTANLTVTDTVAGALTATQLDHTTDAAQIVRTVYVKGANAAGTGYMTDSSGKQGRIAYIDDSTVDTADKLANIQIAYLNQFVIANRGTVSVEGYTPTDVHQGSHLILTDTQSGATGDYRIFGIRKTFNPGGTENWTVTYGGLPPSATNLIRRLTRGTRS